MSDRPTPETDAALYPMHQVDIVWPEFARKLERERDEAREELMEWRPLCLWGGTPEYIHQFIKGQQARIHRTQDIEAKLKEAGESCDMWIKSLGEAREERDEARAVANALADIAFKHLTSLLASTPHSKDAAHEEETQQVIAAIKQWKELKQ